MVHGGEESEQGSPWMAYGGLSDMPNSPSGGTIVLRWAPGRWSNDWRQFVDHVRTSLDRTPFDQAYGGYSHSEVDGCNSRLRRQLAQRFLGIDFDEISATTRSASQGIRSVSWLTCLSNQLVDRLGGRSVLARLPSDVIVHELGTGVLLALGNAPTLGDVNTGETMELYREVSRVLMPIRNLDPWNWTNDMGETAAWYKRFDP
jgi:hypothetical protein